MTKQEEIQTIFGKQVAAKSKYANSTLKQRRRYLKNLHQAILKYREKIKTTLYEEYHKPGAEVDLSEIFPLTSEIKHVRRNLGQWMQKKRVVTPLPLIGSSSYIQFQAKGNSLIISPWNFPVQLTFGPLISALAAGCTSLIKPSELTPKTSELIKQIIEEVFEPDHVAVVLGGVEESTALLDLPFNHIFFTGSPTVGKIVMKAAAQHLASVTLELGGKSPTIVDKSANIDQAANRIAWAKFFNNGQICIAPDYILVHEDVKEKFVVAFQKYSKRYYGKAPEQSQSYARIVNEKHYKRLSEQIPQKELVLQGGETDKQSRFIAPTLVDSPPVDSKLYQEEIFGPLLPIWTFRNEEELLQRIEEHQYPLALYVYSKNKKFINRVLQQIPSGGACINMSSLHFFNHYLPFGGINNSGIGKSHGYHGFLEFTNQKAVLQQKLPAVIELLTPPYNNFKQKLIDLTIKWF